MKKVLLDTNAYSRLLSGDDTVARFLDQAELVFLPVFVIAELLTGFKKGNREAENRSLLLKFEEIPKVERVYAGDETAEIFSDILQELQEAGKPIPTHDIWIAALAIETGSVLISFDKHFQHISKVRLWKAS